MKVAVVVAILVPLFKPGCVEEKQETKAARHSLKFGVDWIGLVT